MQQAANVLAAPEWKLSLKLAQHQRMPATRLPWNGWADALQQNGLFQPDCCCEVGRKGQLALGNEGT